ncbi:ABC transporter ATP-binding protein [Bacillus sp. V3B]|uniref:ABC transporter ATP-binding protein n=1 Tax=Bacillus sp. V3B TaxID=2804915 RepID=UPI00210BB98A|nr:ABC transporter ATP-binding protein [Bacillus sp. V3B]MCQ6274941.1 ABC transporter ATP-binding protein [Bacillus sp. V3B]
MSLISIHIEKAGYEVEKSMIHDIQFSIHKGELIGLIGANGAGKSTTIKSALGLIPFLKGDITFKKNITTSYLPERPIFYDELTFQEHIHFIADVEQLSDEIVFNRVTPLLEQFNMTKHIHELPVTYSKGMQQKAMIILALMTKPDLLIIDEPFIGLDPIATKLLLDIIRQERNRGVGILMCTHVLDTAEKICDQYVLINEGQQIAYGTLADFRISCHLQQGSLFECYHHFIKADNNE